MTPEGRVKAKVNRILKPYIDSGAVYKFMPVQSGYGAKTLDYLLCVAGKFVAIETKAASKAPTPLQWVHIRQIERAGGECFVICGIDDTQELEEYLAEQCASTWVLLKSKA